MLKGCTAAIVAAAPIEGTLLKGGKDGMNYPNAREAFLKSDEYVAVAKVLPFCRLWCVLGVWHDVLNLSRIHPTLSVHQCARSSTTHYPCATTYISHLPPTFEHEHVYPPPHHPVRPPPTTTFQSQVCGGDGGGAGA